MLKTLLLYTSDASKKLLSYNSDWEEAVFKCDKLATKSLNLKSIAIYQLYWIVKDYDLIILLHSTNSNSPNLLQRFINVLNKRRGKLVIFIGNEYTQMNKKISIINRLNAEFIATQLTEKTSSWLYSDCPNSKVVLMPHALNEAKFKCEIPISKREIDIGVRNHKYPLSLGDADRLEIINFFQNDPAVNSLKRDISYDVKDRFNATQWKDFLNNCKATISTEAGTSCLEKDDNTRYKIDNFIKEHPEQAKFEIIYEKFFKNFKNPVSAKLISSRHFDAIGCKTCQIMFDGNFNNILKPDLHYLKLDRDYNNINEVLEKLNDHDFRKNLVDSTYEYVMDSHRHFHRMNHLIDCVMNG